MSQQPNYAFVVPSPTPQPINQVVAPVAFYPLATNALAITALILGCVAWVVPFIGGLIAVIFGHVALVQARRRGEAGRNLALTGLIMGYLSLIVWVLFIVSIVATEFPAIVVPGVGTVDV